MATLQDLGFVIENADAELGIVNASRLDGYRLKMTRHALSYRMKKLGL